MGFRGVWQEHVGVAVGRLVDEQDDIFLTRGGGQRGERTCVERVVALQQGEVGLRVAAGS